MATAIPRHLAQERDENIDPGLASSRTSSDRTGAIDLAAEQHRLKDIITPPDSYTDEGVYWGDLPMLQRFKWTTSQFLSESKRELFVVGRMFINDPLEPWRQYSNKFIITGMGLFVEGFTLFSIGNLTPLFAAVWPKCWGSKPTQCTKTWVEAVSYLEIIGIIIGQILVGIEGDWIGRKFGLVQDALIMSLGTIMLISVWGTSLQGWVIAYGWSLFVYGIGVGGEYPMTSTSTMEGSSSATSGDRLHRGRNVVLPFLMQGWGQLFNQTILILLLLMFHSQAGPPYTETSAQYIYRVSFAAILPFTLYLAYWRAYKVGYGAANGELMRSRKRTGRTGGYDIISLKLCITHYWGRLFATAFGWFANDFAFYGNKIFQSNFIAVIVPHTHNINIGWLWNLINVGVAMFGYYFAALLIDYKPFGRNKMQILGFLGDFICFVIPAAMYNQLTKRGSGIHWFQSLYFLSSFFQQFGPNCTTFLVAAEVYPASIRSTAHGFSAAAGKLGALAPTILYNYIGSRTRFWVVSWFGLAGAIVTWLFLPDVTGLDLREQERYWEYVRAGRADEYHGVAIHPRHLSVWERVVLKRHRNYDPEKDRESKIAELRKLFELREGDKAREVSGNHDDDDLLSDEVAEYFRREKGIVGVKRG